MTAAQSPNLAQQTAPAEAQPVDKATRMDASAMTAAARLVLAPTRTSGDQYPIRALGPLADACNAVATNGQLRPAMAGQCLLAAAALLTQGLWNVETMAGVKPLSLYLLTLGESGDGKSTAQGVALRAVTQWQRRTAQTYGDALRQFETARAGRKRGDELPDEPKMPFRLVGDATVEGLRRDLDGGSSSQGVFSDEAAAILSGYGMSPEHRSKTAGVFSKLWDDGHLSISRVGGGRVERYGRRLSLHWLIQPMAAAESLGDPLLSALGFWPRFLLSWPDPSLPRKARAFRPDEVPAINAYWRRCEELLAIDLPDDAGDCPTIGLSPEAREVVEQAFERFEKQAKLRDGALRDVKPFALRATEQVCRISGVLAAFAGRGKVSGDDARNALSLALHSIGAWQSVMEHGAMDPSKADALRLFEWVANQPGAATSTTDILKRATPHSLRSKDTRDGAIALLHAHRLIDREGQDVWIDLESEVFHGAA